MIYIFSTAYLNWEKTIVNVSHVYNKEWVRGKSKYIKIREKDLLKHAVICCFKTILNMFANT